MNTTIAKPTPGPWRHSFPQFPRIGGHEVYDGRDRLVAMMNHHPDRQDEASAHADLIAEAGTVYHETGLTPRQLADELKFSQGHCDRLIADRNDQVEHHNRMVDERNEARAENARLRNQRAELIAALESILSAASLSATIRQSFGKNSPAILQARAVLDRARAKAVPK